MKDCRILKHIQNFLAPLRSGKPIILSWKWGDINGRDDRIRTCDPFVPKDDLGNYLPERVSKVSVDFFVVF
jgi:hypothetical protein